jgi:micrococcal nuclease
MPKPLIARLLFLLVVAVVAHLYFRREAAEQIAATERAAPHDAPSGPPPTSAPRAERLGPCEVTHVTDGDTLNVRCEGRKERVRMLQIDTPERDDALYEEAGEALEALIAGRAVELEIGDEERDDHGRLLAYVWIGDEHVNLAMIRAGWSPYFDRYGAGRYPRDFADAERAARESNLGIWASE